MTYDAAPRSSPPAGSRPSGQTSASRDDRRALPLLIDCDTCSARGIGCPDCVVTVLLDGPPAAVTLNDDERRAVDVLAAAGLVPPLRLVQGVPSEPIDPP